MKVTDEMIEAARNSLIESSGKTYFPSNYQIRAALEAAFGVRPKQAVHVQDPRIIAESLIAFGPSSDGAVERDLRHALDQQTACIEYLAEVLRPLDIGLGEDDPTWDDRGLAEIELTIGDLRRARVTLEKLGLK